MARSTMLLSIGWILGFCWMGSTGTSLMCLSAMDTDVSPVKGTVPVSISYSMTPVE